MTDAHDEAARALDAEIRETLPPLLRPSTPLEDGLMRQIIAAALRKAAADERELTRERAAQIAETHVGYHVNGVAHSVAAAIRSDGCDECLACRAREKGGA